MIHLKNKIVVVTGGEGLIGKEFLAHIREAGGTAVSADIVHDASLKNDAVGIDIADEKSIDRVIAEVVKQYGRIDGWINSAFPRTEDWRVAPGEVSADDWRKNIDMHLTGYFLCSRAALEVMKQQKSGSLINLGSIYGVRGPDYRVYAGDESIANPVTYGAIKGGVITMTQHLAAYYGRFGLRANCISPGGVQDTKAHAGKFVDEYSKRVPLKRMATPADVAPAAVYLLSDSASYVTGANLMIDGGWSAV